MRWLLFSLAVVTGCGGDEAGESVSVLPPLGDVSGARGSAGPPSDAGPGSDASTVDATDAGPGTVGGPDVSDVAPAAPPDTSIRAGEDAPSPSDALAEDVGPAVGDGGDVADASQPNAEDAAAIPPDAGGSAPDVGSSPPSPLTVAACFAAQQAGLEAPPVDYDQYAPIVGSHCKGTNQQDITGVQRVVFVGDSITIGTPPTPATDWYRNVVAAALADQFGLTPPDWLWQNVDLVNGITLSQHSGDFWSCAKFGARTDDILAPPHRQLEQCNPDGERDKTTLIVMTVGGNDIFAWAKALVDGASVDDIWAMADQATADLEEALHWVVDDPARFPNGVYVVFANTYEFTDQDSGSDLATCPGANLLGMDWALIDPDLTEITRWFMGEYMRIAVDTGTDLVFMGEQFCGHGYTFDDPASRCYRGPNTDLWLDITCMHPNGVGHAGIADIFLSTIAE